ncbi:hypothetical protein Cri9333_3928 [Crinalium epipsammum PCC 9333]|uniref:Lipoprotein n=1 Tax=Crinalium epipsammum PCC 9333 TaxID=1173022 RepID=K9W3F6_9CYAN|nr:hypothetical protein [Crinalium epipsammum]AFZ14736.1 hypothetical protein Cri9333_3928 [Crinalium epipsammum PCC 9333]
MKQLLISLLLVSLSMEVTISATPSLAQSSNCPTLEAASLSGRSDTSLRSSMTQYFRRRGRTGEVYNLVVIGKYGMAYWWTRDTATPIAIFLNRNSLRKAYILDNGSSTNSLVAIGFPRSTAVCLQQLLNESGI